MDFAGIATALVLQLALAPLMAQLPAPPPPASGGLKVLILEGEGVINNVRQRAARELSAQVNDEQEKPVAGATVSFLLPSQGPGGTLPNGTSNTTVQTDAHGRAVAKGFRPNNLPGKLEISVTASYQGRAGRATITQFNMLVQAAPRKSGHGKIIAIVALVGAAAAGGAYAGLHKSGSTPVSAPAPIPSITLSPGTGTVGAPH
jgi:hypothetical protein